MAKTIFIVVETYRNDDITDTTDLRGSFVSYRKAVEKVNELYKERVADYTEAFHDDFNNEKASDSFILDYNEYETMCEVNIVEQELDETPDADSNSNDEATYELYSKCRFEPFGCVEEVIDEYGTEEEALKALHTEIELVIKAYEMKKFGSHWRFSSPTWRAERGQEYYQLAIRKVKWDLAHTCRGKWFA